MSPRSELDRSPLWLGFILAGACILLASLQGCSSLTGSSALQKVMADAEAEIASTDCRMAYACLGYRQDLAEGQTCADILPSIVPPAGFAAPAPCKLLYESRRDAKGHLGAAAEVVSNGSDAPELRRKLKRDIAVMRKADKDLR